MRNSQDNRQISRANTMEPGSVHSERLAALACRWRRGDIGDAVYAALYFLCWQAATCGRRFASRKFKGDPRPDWMGWFGEIERAPKDRLSVLLIRYVERQHFLGVSSNVTAAICAWLKGQWRLTLCEHIPSPEEILHMQVEGTRPVTILSDPTRMLRPVLHKPNAFAFMLHDLEHAYRFFHDPRLHAGQRRFFKEIRQAIEQGLFNQYRRDPTFEEKLHYLMSDMNTHVMHSLQFLKAILIEFHLRHEQRNLEDRLSECASAEISALMDKLILGLGPVDETGGKLSMSCDRAFSTMP
jgi:hypothetical protein